MASSRGRRGSLSYIPYHLQQEMFNVQQQAAQVQPPPGLNIPNQHPLLPTGQQPHRFHFSAQDVRLKSGNNFRRKNQINYRQRNDKVEHRYGHRHGPEQNVIPNKVHMACTRCHRFYDLAARSPLLLKCNHTMCEDCISSKISPDGVKIQCAECNQETHIQASVKSDFQLKEHFPVNYYLAGRIYYNRQQERAELSSLQFVPAGIRSPAASIVQSQIGGGHFKERCSSASCKEEASLRCTDCDEVYCKKCSDNLHKAAKGLKQHKIQSIFIDQCHIHHGNPQDFQCFNCNSYFCSYCIIEEHKDHSHKQITKLGPNDVDRFKCLLENSNEVLKKLEITHQMVKKKINKIKPKKVNQEIEKKIGKCFLDLHGKLQKIERALVLQAAGATNATLESLREVERELFNNISVVTELISLGENVVKRSNANAWQNIDLIMQRMYNANKLPHTLLIDEAANANIDNGLEFEYIEFTDDWSEHFKLNTTEKKKFKLVAENEEVAGYTNIFDSQSDTSSISEITIGSHINKSIFIHSGEKENRLKQEAINLKFQPDMSFFLNDELMSVTSSQSVKDFPAFQSTTSLTKGTMENVVVTHIVAPNKIYVQLSNNYRNIQNLHVQLDYYVQNLFVANITTPTVNELYLVKYNLGVKTMWRRGVVIKITSNQDCLVKLIDYGNNINVLFDNMRTINDQAGNIPPFVIECRLYDLLEPPDQLWNEDDATLIADMMSGCNVTMSVKNIVSSCIMEVDLKVFSTGEEFSLRDSLLFLGRGVCNDCEDVTCVVTPATHSVATEGKKREKDRYYDQIMKLNDSHEVVIVNVVDGVTFYVQICKVTEFSSKLRLSMSEYYNKELEKGKVYAPRVGMTVAVRHNINTLLSHWNRGLIMEVNQGTGSVKVLLVDLGEEHTLSYEDIRLLNKKFLSYTRMAFKVKLAHVNFQNEKQNEIGKEVLAKYNGMKLKMIIHAEGKVPEVILLECHQMVDFCVNAHVVRAGMKSTGFLSQMLEWQHDEDPDELENETITTSLVKQSQGANESSDSDESEDESIGLKLEPVKVLNVINPHCIYVHLCENEKFMKKLIQLNLSLQKHYSTRRFKTRESWNVNDYGVAYYKTTKQYFRILINKQLSDNQYEVFSQDFGNIFVVKCDGIGELDEEFRSSPPFALKVRLYGVNPLGKWSLMAADYIKDMVKGKQNVLVTRLKNNVDGESNVPVVMWIREVKPVSALEKTKVKTVNLSKLLSKNGLGILSKDYELPKPTLPPPKANSDDGVPIGSASQNFDDLPFENTFERKWLPAKPINSKNFQAIATYVDETGWIYFHDNFEVSLLQEMENSIYDQFQNIKVDPTATWEVGDLCTVKYHQNQKWYRGEVLGFNQHEKELRVCMIDYGNVEDVKYHEVSKEVMFVDVPRAAKVIRLHDIRAKKGFSTSILDMLHALVVEKVLDITIVEEATETIPASAFVHQGKVNLNAFMRNELKTKGKSKSHHGQANAVEQLDDDVVIDEVIEGNSSNKKFLPRFRRARSVLSSRDPIGYNKTNYTYVDLPKTELFEISVINIIDMNKIVFEVVRAQTDNLEFAQLSAEINRNWSDQPVLQSLTENEPCIARYHVDNVWYRGRLFTKSDKIRVHFVDFGNVEEVPPNDIRVIKPAWLQHPVEQYVGVLSDIQLVIDKHPLLVTTVNQHLSHYIESNKLAKITKRDPLSIQLFNTDTKRLSYLELIETGILKPLN